MPSSRTATDDSSVFTVVIPPELKAIKQARDLMAFAFERWELDGYLAMTIVTELATNACRHGSRPDDPITIRTYRDRAGLPVIEVWDESPEKPHVRPLNVEAETGRGLYLVEQLCHTWGFQPREQGGKVVFAVIQPITS